MSFGGGPSLDIYFTLFYFSSRGRFVFFVLTSLRRGAAIARRGKAGSVFFFFDIWISFFSLIFLKFPSQVSLDLHAVSCKLD